MLFQIYPYIAPFAYKPKRAISKASDGNNAI
jgi:hypothetical protein